jgi:hypothetical protein
VGNVRNKLYLLHRQKNELQFSGTNFLPIKVPVLVFCGLLMMLFVCGLLLVVLSVVLSVPRLSVKTDKSTNTENWWIDSDMGKTEVK